MEIHIRRGDDHYGPYSMDEVRAYIGEGRLTLEDLASTDSERWRPLRMLLGEPAGTASPPPPAVSTGAPAPARYQPAEPVRRFGAAILDLLFAGAFLLPGLLVWLAGPHDDFFTDDFALVGAGAVCAVIYQFVKDGFGGQSLGKRVTGLIVVHLPTNRPCSVGRSIVRTLVLWLTNGLPGIGALIEPVLVIVTSDRRRLGDRAASTQVIRLADYAP